MARVVCVALVAVLHLDSTLSARIARAEDVAAKQVEKLAADAIAAYKAADYTRTVELLERAYAIRQVAALLYNLAKAYEKLGDQEKAVELYRRYSDSTDADPKLRVKAEARVAAFEEARRTRKDPHGDGELHPRLDATPDPVPDPHPLPRASREPPESPDARALRNWKARRARDRVIGLSLGGIGVACAAAGLGLGVHAMGLHGDFAGGVGPEDPRRALRDDSRNQALAADVLFGVAAVSVGVGSYFIWRGYHPEKAPGARVSTLAPFGSPQGGGLVVGGSF